jgi:hypothetical protein
MQESDYSYTPINLAALTDLSKFPREEARVNTPFVRQVRSAERTGPRYKRDHRKIISINGNGSLPVEEYPNVDGLPIRGKRFLAREENPKFEELGNPGFENPDKATYAIRYRKLLKNIKEWENEHNQKPKKLKLDELKAADYKYIYAKNSDIKIEQIDLGGMNEELWLTYRRIEGAYQRIMIEDLKAGRQTTVYSPLSPYPAFHDGLIQLRNRIHNETGINYRTVDRGLNYMLKKDIIRDLRIHKVDFSQEWNQTACWKIQNDSVIEARGKYGKDWIREKSFEWSMCAPGWDYVDRSWAYLRQYSKEHQIFL